MNGTLTTLFQFVYVILTLLGIAGNGAAIYSYRQGVQSRQLVRRETSHSSGDFSPPATVIVPCRGIEPALERNLSSIVAQNYPDYEVLFVVDDEADGAVETIRRVLKNSKHRLIVSHFSGLGSGKVRAIVAGIAQASARSEVFVFVDSDSRVGPSWLGTLVSKLGSAGVGAATSFRWYADENGLQSALASAWNASGTSSMFNRRYNFVWGGSWAIRRVDYECLDMSKQMMGYFSDDMAATRALRQAKMPILFAPSAMVVASWKFPNFSGFLEWVHFQVATTRIYNRPLWKYAAISYASFNGLTLIGLASIIYGAIFGDAWLLLPGVLMVLHVPIGILRADLRWRTFKEVMAEHNAAFTRRWAHDLASALVSWVMLYSIARSRRQLVFRWRERKYTVGSDGRVLAIA